MDQSHPLPLLEALEEYSSLKKALQQMQAALDAQLEVVMSLSETNDEGTYRFKTDNHKFTLTTKLNRAVDQKAVAGLPTNIQEEYFTSKYSLDSRKFKSAPMDDVLILSSAITTKPAKPQIKIEEVSNDARESN